jgi:hypothetical protein
MQRGILFGVAQVVARVAVLAGIVSCGLGVAHATATTKPGIDLHKHPADGKSPVEVSVGLYITNLVAIDENRETFEVSGYLIGGGTRGWRCRRIKLRAMRMRRACDRSGWRTSGLPRLKPQILFHTRRTNIFWKPTEMAW